MRKVETIFCFLGFILGCIIDVNIPSSMLQNHNVKIRGFKIVFIKKYSVDICIQTLSHVINSVDWT